MAYSPTFWSRPGLVTLPTPFPPSIWTSSLSGIKVTSADTIVPLVMSGSSPLSFSIEQLAVFSLKWGFRTSMTRSVPLGVVIETEVINSFSNNIVAAAFDAAAAQVPVV